MPSSSAPAVWVHNGVRVIEDHEWGCRRQDPLPSAETVRRLYAEQYFREIQPDFDSRRDADREYWDRVHEDKRINLARLLGRDRARLLDIGCGNGALLGHFQQHGWTVLGIEPSPLAALARRKYGIDCREMFIEDLDQAALDASWDVVHFCDVLEHVVDPYGLLARCRALLRRDGVLCVDMGLDFNPFQLAAVESLRLPYWWIVPEHITYWSDAQMTAALVRAGFTIAYKESDLPIDMFLLMGLNYVSDPTQGPVAHQMRLRFEDALVRSGRDDLRRRLFAALASVGIGRTIRYYCRLTPPN